MEDLNNFANGQSSEFDPIPEPDSILETDSIPETDSVAERDFIAEPTSDPLAVPEDMVTKIVIKAGDISIDNDSDEIPDVEVGRKCCPTRHGCQGATDCDYAYGSYPF